MKFIHLSDLHLGKRVNEFSMMEEQAAILEQILTIIEDEMPDGVLIAGDVYDKAIPPAEAVQLFDDFLVKLAARRKQVFIISGNHDSAERISFASRIMNPAGIHIAPVYDGKIEPITLSDAHGDVDVYLLPFIKPAHVNRVTDGDPVESYTDAAAAAISMMHINPRKRNVLVAHQFVTGASRSESEEIVVGGLDNVDADVFRDFDYVALGHIHGAQNCAGNRVRYCGTPLKYSFSEVHHEKSVTVVELGEKGSELQIRTIPLIPLHDMSELRGTFAELNDSVFYMGNPVAEHYLHITLTDEDDVADAIGRLRQVYPRLMRLDYDNKRTRSMAVITGAAETRERSALDLFAEFFEQQNNAPMSEVQTKYMADLIEKIEEELA